MGKWDFLKNYLFSEQDPSSTYARHAFFKLTEQDISEAENRIGRPFPKELRDFYEEIGYGFLCNDDKNSTNRLMDPGSVADFRLGEDIYETDPDREMYENPDHLAFFDISDGLFLTLDMSRENSEGICPVYYIGTRIADSISEFLHRMDEKLDYYFDLT